MGFHKREGATWDAERGGQQCQCVWRSFGIHQERIRREEGRNGADSRIQKSQVPAHGFEGSARHESVGHWRG